ncbi:hypothetical protein QUB70_07420 [Microcoleus sp. A003_D6]|uniref:hypothetical protein n=1 Tax=Microcoleus sp. A003_D6 TaxID=3055266 RepID=UPI002FD488EF
MLRPGPRDKAKTQTKTCDRQTVFPTLTRGQGEALADLYFGYDSSIVAANASPLQTSKIMFNIYIKAIALCLTCRKRGGDRVVLGKGDRLFFLAGNSQNVVKVF